MPPSCPQGACIGQVVVVQCPPITCGVCQVIFAFNDRDGFMGRWVYVQRLSVLTAGLIVMSGQLKEVGRENP